MPSYSVMARGLVGAHDAYGQKTRKEAFRPITAVAIFVISLFLLTACARELRLPGLLHLVGKRTGINEWDEQPVAQSSVR